MFFLRNQFTIRTNEMAVTSGNQTLNTVFFLSNMWVSIRAETDCWRFNPSRNQTVLGKHLLRRLLKGYLDLPEFGCAYMCIYIYTVYVLQTSNKHMTIGDLNVNSTNPVQAGKNWGIFTDCPVIGSLPRLLKSTWTVSSIRYGWWRGIALLTLEDDSSQKGSRWYDPLIQILTSWERIPDTKPLRLDPIWHFTVDTLK